MNFSLKYRLFSELQNTSMEQSDIDRLDLLVKDMSLDDIESCILDIIKINDRDCLLKLLYLFCNRYLPAYFDVIEKSLEHFDSTIRIQAIETIVELDSGKLLFYGDKLLQDSDELVRAYAGWGLGKSGKRDAIGVLKKYKDKECSLLAMCGIYEGIAKLTNDKKYLFKIFEFLKNDDYILRVFCINSLRGLFDGKWGDLILIKVKDQYSIEDNVAVRNAIESNFDVKDF